MALDVPCEDDHRAAQAGVGLKGTRAERGDVSTWPTITVVIPTLNEAANLPHVLSRIPAIVDELVLVDGHSDDDTIAVARAIRPDVRIVVQDRRGKGNALACGFAAARGDVIVMIDADGSNDPAEIPRFVEALINIRIARSGLAVREVPSREHPRLHGESKLRAFHDGGRVLRTILSERVRRNRPSREKDDNHWHPAFHELPGGRTAPVSARRAGAS